MNGALRGEQSVTPHDQGFGERLITVGPEQEAFVIGEDVGGERSLGRGANGKRRRAGGRALLPRGGGVPSKRVNVILALFQVVLLIVDQLPAHALVI